MSRQYNNFRPKKCKAPSCQYPCYIDNTGKEHDFCSRTCSQKYSNSPQSNHNSNNNYHGSKVSKGAPSHSYGRASTFDLEILHSYDKDYKDVETQFFKKWLHGYKTKPRIVSIMRVNKVPYYDAFRAYKYKLQQEGVIPYKLGEMGNTQRRFHGTNYLCDLGTNGNNQLCSKPKCSLCGIIKTGWKIRLAGSKNAYKTFGDGIYFTSTSSKSHSFAGANKSGHRAIIVGRVAIGNGYKINSNNTRLKGPPKGYHSVLAEPSLTGTLNYDEVVVYREDAAVPGFIVITK